MGFDHLCRLLCGILLHSHGRELYMGDGCGLDADIRWCRTVLTALVVYVRRCGRLCYGHIRQFFDRTDFLLGNDGAEVWRSYLRQSHRLPFGRSGIGVRNGYTDRRDGGNHHR